MKQQIFPPLVILAAGCGRRIAKYISCPKVLLPFGLKTLLEAHLTAPFSKKFLVIGCKKEEIKAFLKERGYSPKLVEGSNWKKGGTKYGRDLLSCEKLLREPFFYVMGDHFIDYEQILDSIKLALELLKKGKKFILFVDSTPRYANIKSQSKLLIKNGKILKYGKELEQWNALDVGLFLTTPEIFERIRKAMIHRKDFDTADILGLFREDEIGIIDIKGAFWFGVNTIEDYQRAKYWFLRKKLSYRDVYLAAKQGKAGVLAHLFYKKISAGIAYVLIKAFPKIRAEHINFLRMIFGFSLLAWYITAKLALHTKIFYLLVGFLLFDILDGVDGAIARIKAETSEFGGLMDSVSDLLIYETLFFVLLKDLVGWKVTATYFLLDSLHLYLRSEIRDRERNKRRKELQRIIIWTPDVFITLFLILIVTGNPLLIAYALFFVKSTFILANSLKIGNIGARTSLKAK